MRAAKAAAIIPILFVAACANTGPRADRAVVQTSLVPVAVPCSADVGPTPDFVDTAAAIAAVPAGDIYNLAKLYAGGRQQHLEYEARLEAANAGCSKTRPAP